MNVFKICVASAVVACGLLVGALPASARTPCPPGMSPNTVVVLTDPGGYPTGVGVGCSKDGHLYRVEFDVARLEAPAADESATGGSEALYNPCDDTEQYYIPFFDGYFHCSKDGRITYHVVV